MISIKSPRLDAVISAVFILSRGDSAKLISGGKVSINWAPVVQNSREIGMGDIISARGYGRARIESIEYRAKKERYVVRIRM